MPWLVKPQTDLYKERIYCLSGAVHKVLLRSVKSIFKVANAVVGKAAD